MNIQKQHLRHLVPIMPKSPGRYAMHGIAYSIVGADSNPFNTEGVVSNLASNHDEARTGLLAATNGRALVVVPVLPCDDDIPAIIERDTMTDACRRPAAAGGVSTIRTAGGLSTLHPVAVTVANDGATYEREGADGEYPRISVVMESEGYEPCCTVDADYLIQCLRAVGGTGGGKNARPLVRLCFKRDASGRIATTSPIRIESIGEDANNPGAIGMTMPCSS